MSSMSKYLLLAMLTALVPACATLPLKETPEVRAIHPRIAGIDLRGLNLIFDIDVSNPYPIAIRTPRLRYGLDVEGSKFFESETTFKVDLPAKKIGTLALPVRLSYSDLLRTYKDLSGRAEADYTFKGALVLPLLGRSFELPLSHSGTFPIVRPPRFSNVRVQVPRVSLIKTRIAVNVAMTNPNAFALGIRDLGYVLKLGDVELGGLTASTVGSLEAGQTEHLSLTGEISAASAIINMIRGGNIGGAQILPSGAIQTPYGPVNLRR